MPPSRKSRDDGQPSPSWQTLSLSHYAPEPFELRPVCYLQREMDMKPNGLWLSVDGDDDWPAWCRAEDFRLGDIAVRYRIRLKPHARILHLGSRHGIDWFSRQYVTDLPKPLRHLTGQVRSLATMYPNWELVARQYQGMIIAPYIWERRLGDFCCSWYYGWDCASGCIWDLRAIDVFVQANDAGRAKRAGD